jgi:hypothetical protein
VASDHRTCEECGDVIEPGEVYFAHAVTYRTEEPDPERFDGTIVVSRSKAWAQCEPCQDAAAMLQGLGYTWNPGDLEKAWAQAWRKEG